MQSRYFHGGQSGLKVGDYILPATVTGTKHRLGERAKQAYRADRVYLCATVQLAAVFAKVHPSEGWVYEVEPEGMLASDYHCSVPGAAFSCEKARIVKVFVPGLMTNSGAIRPLQLVRP